MFIYMIEIENKKYFGLDTKPTYKNSRWKHHCREAKKNNPKQKIHQEMKRVGIENCIYVVIEENFKSIGSLALAEINYIKKYNTYETGLNSSRGGDGLGKHDLFNLSEEDIKKIREELSQSMSDYNVNYKWANTSLTERKHLTSHLHTEEVYQKKSESLKEYYNRNPNEKKKRGEAIKRWQESNKEKLKETNKKNSLLGAEKISKKILVEEESGKKYVCRSKQEFHRLTGQWANTVIDKTKKGLYHNGYKASEI